MKYINRDITKIREDMIANVKLLTDRWTDFSESDLGVVLLETVAGTVDMLNYYLDHQALETYLSTAQEPKNIKSILTSYGSKFLNTSSVVTQVFQVPNNNTLTSPLTISKYTKVSDGHLSYYTSKDIVIPLGTSQVEVPAYQGTLYSKDFSINAITNYQYIITDLNLSKDLIELTNLTQVEDAFLLIEGGPYYSIHQDRLNNWYIQFTWDYLDYFNEDQILNIKYLVTDGEVSVSPYALNRVEPIQQGANKINIVTFNKQYASGGSLESDIDYNLAKANSMLSIKSMGRLITLQDYQAYMDSNSNLIKSICLDWSVEDSGVNSPYTLDIRCVPKGSYTLNTALRDTIEEEISKISSIALQVNLKEPDYIPVNLDILLTIDSEDSNKITQIKSQVSNHLNDFFSPYNQEFGKDVRIDTVRAKIFEVSPLIVGIQFLDKVEDFQLHKYQFLKVENIFIDAVKAKEV